MSRSTPGNSPPDGAPDRDLGLAFRAGLGSAGRSSYHRVMSNPNGRATKPDRPADAAPGTADSLAAAPFDPDSGGRPAWDAAAAAVLRKGGRLPSGEPDAAAW